MKGSVDDYAAVAAQMNGLAPATTGDEPPAPAPAPAIPAPQVTSGGSSVDDYAATAASMNLQQAQAINTSNNGVDPAKAAEANKISSVLQLPPAAVATDQKMYKEQAETQQSNATLARYPALAAAGVDDPNILKARDDFNRLGKITQFVTAFKYGLSIAPIENANNRSTYDNMWGTPPPPTPEDAARNAALSTPDGVNGELMNATKGLGELIGSLNDQLTQPSSVAAMTAGGVAGATLGPLAPLSAAAGIAAGATMSLYQQGAMIGTGQIANALHGAKDHNGMPISPTIANAAAVAGGQVLGLLNVLSLHAATGPAMAALTKVMPEVVQKIAASPSLSWALSRVIGKTAVGSAEGAILMGASQIVAGSVPDIAKLIDGGKYDTMFTNPAKMNEFQNSVLAAAENGAITIGFMHFVPHALSAAGDMVKAIKSDNNQKLLNATLDQSAESTLRQKDPATFNGFMNGQMKGSPAENLYVPHENVQAIYDRTGTAPGETDTTFGFVPDMVDQMARAKVAGGDVVIPTADYATHIAGTPVDGELRPFLKTDPQGASMNDLEEFKNNFGDSAVSRAQDIEGAHANATGDPLHDYVNNEVDVAAKQNSIQPLFTSPEQSGMSPEQFQQYQEIVVRASEDARKTMLDKATADVNRRRDKQWKDQEAVEREAATKVVESRQDLNAHDIITSTVRGEGKEGIPQVKLDRDALVAKYGEGILDQFPQSNFGPKGITKKGGVHPDLAAEMLGYDSGQKLVEDITALEADRRLNNETTGKTKSIKQILIDRETQQRMTDKHSGILDDGSIQQEALDALHNASRLDVLKAEAEHLAEQKGVFTNDLRGEKQWAKDQISNMPMRDGAKSYKYLQAEQKAGRGTERALLEGRKGDAIVLKKQQLINHLLYDESRKVEQELKKATKQFNYLASKETIKTIDQSYLNHIHTFLANLGFDLKRSMGELIDATKGQSVEDFVRGKLEDGRELMLPDALHDIKTYANGVEGLTVDQFRQIRDTISSFVTNGRDEKTILVDGVRMAKEEAVKALTDTIYASKATKEVEHFFNNKDKGRVRSALDSFTALFRRAGSELIKPEQFMQWLDRNEFLGPFANLIFRPLKDAQNRMNDMALEMSNHFKGMNMSKEWKATLNDRIENKVLRHPDDNEPMVMTRKSMLSLALNIGNKGNLDRLVKGYGWEEKATRDFLNNNMSKEDWDFMQGTFNMFKKQFPEIQDLQRRLSGIAPDKVEALPIDTPYGKYEGGYYPVVYDAANSERAARAEQRSRLYDADYYKATTSKGHTINRIEGFSDRLLIDLDVMPWKLRAAAHDLAYREAVINADKLLSDPRVKKAIGDTWGPEYHAQFRPWLKDIANAPNVDTRPLSFMDSIMSHSRRAMVEMGVGFRLTTALKHGTTALSNSVGELGPTWMRAGIGEYYRDRGTARDKVFSLSGEMAHRANSIDRDLRNTLKPVLGEDGVGAKWKYYSHAMVANLDMESAIPTWLGAYSKALSEGREGRDAAYYADQTVRNAHGAQGTVDLAAVQRGPEYMKMFTSFYGFFSHMFNRMADTVQVAKHGVQAFKDGDYDSARHDTAKVLVRSITYLIIPAMAEAIISGKSKDRDESWTAFTAKAVAGQMAATVPLLRNLAHALEYRDAGGVPVTDMLTQFGHQAKDIYHAAEGHANKKWLQHAITTAGYITPLPGAGQAAVTTQFLWDVKHGVQIPRSALDWTKGLIYGKIK